MSETAKTLCDNTSPGSTFRPFRDVLLSIIEYFPLDDHRPRTMSEPATARAAMRNHLLPLFHSSLDVDRILNHILNFPAGTDCNPADIIVKFLDYLNENHSIQWQPDSVTDIAEAIPPLTQHIAPLNKDSKGIPNYAPKIRAKTGEIELSCAAAESNKVGIQLINTENHIYPSNSTRRPGQGNEASITDHSPLTDRLDRNNKLRLRMTNHTGRSEIKQPDETRRWSPKTTSFRNEHTPSHVEATDRSVDIQDLSISTMESIHDEPAPYSDSADESLQIEDLGVTGKTLLDESPPFVLHEETHIVIPTSPPSPFCFSEMDLDSPPLIAITFDEQWSAMMLACPILAQHD
ncbi:hypothetical protein QCA50_019411 [Cerrena zonata]|uniref:Uncharacterized protein n=1 Tax=Cerrena zonata TaxID=2478898 RepID=A0AAW0FEW2_9APHY